MPKPVQVVTFSETGAPLHAGKKRKRTDLDEDLIAAEKKAYLSGDTTKVLAAATGRLEVRKRREDKPEDPDADRHRIQVDFRDMFKDVTALGAASFRGKDKKIWEAKQLAAAGAHVVHKEKMPLKMALGVLQARRKRAEKQAAELRAGNIITGKRVDLSGTNAATGGAGGDKLGSKRFKGASAFGQPDSLDHDTMRGPVMYVKKDGHVMQGSSSRGDRGSSRGGGGGGFKRFGGGGGGGGGRGRGRGRGGRPGSGGHRDGGGGGGGRGGGSSRGRGGLSRK